MTVARMWESRLEPAQVAEFLGELTGVAWPALAGAAGFAGGEAYRSTEGEHRVVLVTRWADEPSAAAAVAVEESLARFCARPPHAWQFAQLDL